MNPLTLKALRGLLFFSRPEAATLLAAGPDRPAGVSDRAWRQWEAGERPIPGDVEEKVFQLVTWRQKTLAARKAQIAEFLGKAGGQGKVAIVWYETLDDWATLPDRDPAVFWRPLQSVIAELAAEFPEKVRLQPFNAAAYAEWLGNRGDSENMRARWAADAAE